ncbi:fimbrial isopeptide formation D2 domain [uncultured Roseburia sp.]|uniref:SpaH/EbpB family LPXTG-anchored major pilin n=1 Tax=Brotonthovivens ammoniilytica TaxID=2981725 RepID=A0ABT2TID3_9FIRM|nr:SpaH/EbpB family LPXTG-anchored major pilin [Brotonthovivens ammoniilytica]MCU6761431.1 SpaH/EbpB family LPXTG-anchored major pilin [Brotonthovivens ammoniilytica]SCI28234.1 fimbrial isopeptide formation D2 domain [uncultured Roseburia sp.]
MKKKWFRRLLALSAAALLSIGSLTAFAAPDDDQTNVTITPVDQAYYESLPGMNGAKDAEIQITKRISNVDGNSFENNAKPVEGVEFGITQVGIMAQMQKGSTTTMVYGIENELAKLLTGIVWDGTDSDYKYVKDYKKINEALQKMTSHQLQDYAGLRKEKTNNSGVVTFDGEDFGLYLVVETDVSDAQVDGKPVTITRTQYPYVVSAPIYNEADKTWSALVEARAKNETGTADSEKKIVYGADDLNDSKDKLVDNDNTNIGDTVVFRLTNGVIDLKHSADDADVKIEKYVIEDQLSKGLTFTNDASGMEVTDSQGAVYTYGTDYKVKDTKDEKGTQITITFTNAGLAKLTTLSKSNDTNKKVYVDYTAEVNQHAVVGTAGNPNQSRLIFAANGNAEVTTDWDGVKEYIFSLEGIKVFDDQQNDTNAAEVTFALYRDKACKQAFNVSEVTEGTPGSYVPGGTSNIIKPGTDSTFILNGFPADTTTLYLKETDTAEGYHLVKDPIEIKLTAFTNKDGDADAGWGTLTEGTVNGEDARVDAASDPAVNVAFTVNNTSGFRLPSTGGRGAAIFAVAGILIIAAGGGFYFAASRKRR